MCARDPERSEGSLADLWGITWVKNLRGIVYYSVRCYDSRYIMYNLKETVMDAISYPLPVDKLLTYGRPEPKDAQNWPDYLELGLGPEHIPDLVRMTADEELWEAGEDASENWAPVHAWRALGELSAVNAVEPLLPLLVVRF